MSRDISREEHDRPTISPGGLAELKHDVVRLDWAERDAYSRLLRAIEEHPRTREAYALWQCARERHVAAQAKLDVLEAACQARK